MIIKNTRIKTLFLSVALALLTVGGASATIPFGKMIVNADQFVLVPFTQPDGTIQYRTAYGQTFNDGDESSANGLEPQRLIDNHYQTYWASNSNKDADCEKEDFPYNYYGGRHYIEVGNFRGEDGKIGAWGEPGDIIQVKMTNHVYWWGDLPKSMEIFYHNPQDDGWHSAGNVECFRYDETGLYGDIRGYYTTTVKIPEVYDALRLVNNSPNGGDSRARYRFKMSEMQIIKAQKEANSTVYEGACNPNHISMLKGSCGYPLQTNFTSFVHTQSFLDEHNHILPDTVPEWYSDWEGAKQNNWKDADLLAANGIEMPDYRFFKVNGTDRQPAHTMEHTVYALPGVPLVLYPCSDFHHQTAYNFSLVRWYDWNTDKQSPNLFFPYGTDRVFNLESGDFIGDIFRGARAGNTPVFWTDVFTQDEYTVAVDATLNGHVRNENFDKPNRIFYEPTIAFRHIFHVRNAMEMAKELSESVEANNKYIEANKRVVSARTNEDFQVRLNMPIPTNDQKNRSSYDVFYLDENGEVQRGYCPVIEIDGTIYRNNDGIFYGYSAFEGPGGTYFDPVDNRVVSIGHEKATFNRFLFCAAGNTAPGYHKIRLLLTDRNGDVVNIKGTDSPIVIEQFEVTFMPQEAGLVITEETLLNNPEKYEYITPKYMEEKLRLGKPVAVVDFDEYRHLIGKSDYISERDVDKGKGMYMYKWPRPWEQSGYCFGYQYRHDFNMYMLASQSGLTPYHGQTTNYYNAKRNSECTQTTELNKDAQTSNYLYDRLFYETKGRENGFFYYVNAAVDPGKLATMKIDDLCSGATLFVNGWMAEGSGADANLNETQNLIITFQAITKDGKTVKLHSFVTGYIHHDSLGRWHNFYYSFVPNLISMGLTDEDIDHYELFVENNCKNSGGADYYFDDIRVFVAKPRVSASQVTAICQGNEQTDVRISTPYEVLLSSLGKIEPQSAEAGENVCLYYTFVKKDVYDNAIAAGQGHDEAFDKAVLRYDYDGSKDDTQFYGKAYFNTHYLTNRILDEKYVKADEIISRFEVKGERTLFFNTHPSDKTLSVGGEYYMSLVSPQNDQYIPSAKDFDIRGECAKTCSFMLESSSTVKIDGVNVPDMSNIQICDNQWPVVQLDIFKQTPSDIPGNAPDKELVDESAYVDWFDGSLSAYKNAEYNGTPLLEALQHFRKEYKETDDPDQPLTEYYTAAHRDAIIHFSTVFDKDKGQRRPPLTLYKNSYIFPYINVPDNMNSMLIYAVALPIDRYEAGDNCMICTEPSEVRVYVAQKSPFLKHGINSEDISYPELMDDVPLRITLNELHKVSGDIESNDPGYIAKAPALVVPIRETKAVTDGVIRFLMKGEDDYVYLVGTNDPAYKDLGEPAEPDPENPNGPKTKGLRPIGRFRELTAIVTGEKAFNNARLQFRNDDKFRFSEGYWYKVRFDYQEDKENSSNTVCDGQDVLTIKVVPEYAIFTNATGNNNFNNDDNWRRVTSAELLSGAKDRDGDREFVSDGDNANTFSYAPVHTTQIILPVSADRHPLVLNNTTSVPVRYKDVITEADHTAQWVLDLDGKGEASPDITEDIHYDMVAEPHASQVKPSVVCRPWRANTCEDVHLNSGATVFNHPALNYGTASVDFDTKPGMWYSLASPLQSVYAGDMYLPTKGASQNTRLFRDITFETEGRPHDRFRPAVYQRSWNTGKATVYELPGPDTQRNVAIRSTWSNVYNDVQVSYGGGHGFSIKTDVSRAQNPGERVKFRLPKADRTYKYYTMDGTVSGDEQAVTRTNAGRLYDGDVTATLTGAVAGKYFMAGNPYLRYLSPKAFLDANPQLERKIYIMNSEGHLDMVVAADGTVTSTGTLPVPNNGLIAPMQGFFVVANDNKLSQDVTFSLGMAVDDPVADNNPTPLNKPRKARAESTDGFGGITVTASADGQDLSSAVIRLDGAASEKYDADEDVTLFIDGLSDNPRVYTVADGVATTINTLPAIERVEVGLVNDDRPVTLTFTGVDGAGNGYVLYDAETGDVTPLTEGLSVSVRGMASQRFFITAAADDIETIPAIGVSVSGREVTVTATAAGDVLDVMVFDSVGRSILSVTDPSGEATFSLNPGVYVIKASTGPRNLVKKVIIR